MRSHTFLFGSLPRRRPPEFTAILMFEFWREATVTSVPGLLCQSGRRRPENVSNLSSLKQHFFAALLDCDMRLPNFTRPHYGVCEHNTKIVFFFF